MRKYLLTAATLKAFSLTAQTRQLYRFLGNTLGQRRRIRRGLDSHYIRRARRILELFEQEHAIKDGDRLLEIGTGWIHWESTVLRLFYDVEITLFDVWDNRQLDAYKRYMSQLDAILDDALSMVEPTRRQHAHRLLQQLQGATSFTDVYELLGFRYVLNPAGTLQPFSDNAFDAVFSWNVLEHVNLHIIATCIQDFGRVLKPGGYSIHSIDPGDHLAYYDKSVSHKNYLRYSDAVWKRYFENDVQYFNRVQRTEWLQMFEAANLEPVREELVCTDITDLKIDENYVHLSMSDLACVDMMVIHRRPSPTASRIEATE